MRPKNLPATNPRGKQVRIVKVYVTTFVAFTPYLTPRGDHIRKYLWGPLRPAISHFDPYFNLINHYMLEAISKTSELSF
jgi:hypothetical protein